MTDKDLILPSVPCKSCGSEIQAVWYDPCTFNGKPVQQSGGWEYPDLCPGCQGKPVSGDSGGRLEVVRGCSNLGPHQGPRYPALNGAVIEALGPVADDWMIGITSVYVSGPTGCGKTFCGEALLEKALLDYPAKRGRYVSLPATLDEARGAINRNRGRDALHRELLANDYLVLDEIALYQHSPWVLNALWCILDEWGRKKHGGLYVTANKSLDELATILDDRIASRLVGLCRVFELPSNATDRRLAR